MFLANWANEEEKNDEQPPSLVVKSITTYCEEAHHLFADYGFVPKLFDVQRVWKMMVMEHVAVSCDWDESSNNAKLATINMLHSHGFVHSDL